MGKGDKKSKRGKIIMGSFGVSRPSKNKKAFTAVAKEKKETKAVVEDTEKKAPKKPAAKKPKKETTESAE
jgi:ribosomal small subunit protein bTHX